MLIGFNYGVRFSFSICLYCAFLIERFMATALSFLGKNECLAANLCDLYSRLYIVEKVYHLAIYENFMII